MFRRFRRLIVALVLLIIVIAVAAVVLGNRSALDGARSRVDQRWAALRPPLQARYAKLAVVADALAKDVGPTERVPAQITRALKQWNALMAPGHQNPAAEVAIAGAPYTVLRDAVHIHPTRAEAVQSAVADFDKTAAPVALVDAYNAAVRTYEHDRTSGLRRVTAAVFGYGSRRTFEPAPTS